MEIIWRVISWRGKGENGGKVQELRSTNWQIQNRQGDDKNNTGNGVAKKHTCMTHGHELRKVLLEGMRVPGGGRETGENCRSAVKYIINKIYLKTNKQKKT